MLLATVPDEVIVKVSVVVIPAGVTLVCVAPDDPPEGLAYGTECLMRCAINYLFKFLFKSDIRSIQRCIVVVKVCGVNSRSNLIGWCERDVQSSGDTNLICSSDSLCVLGALCISPRTRASQESLRN